MRTIKFRAWDKAEELMCKVTTLTDEGAFLVGVKPGEEQVIPEFRMIIPAVPTGRFCEMQEFELMQFTGLLDKNGKEIFESDIVSDGEKNPLVIVWDQKFASFCLTRDGWRFHHWFGESHDPLKVEVIGNIYETPKLLK